jgi:hypothetical protein
MIEPSGPRAIFQRLGPHGVIALALIGIAALAGGATLVPLVGAALTRTPEPVALPAEAGKDLEARMAAYRAQFDGRTMFFTPAKPPPAPVAVAPTPENNGPPPPPPPPATYGGPAPIAMIFDTVWFADGKKLKAGDPAEGDVRVVRLEPPWKAVLDWKGVEFDVKFFERDSVVIKAPGEKMVEGTAPEPKPAPAPEAVAAPAGATDAAAAVPPVPEPTPEPAPEPQEGTAEPPPPPTDDPEGQT